MVIFARTGLGCCWMAVLDPKSCGVGRVNRLCRVRFGTGRVIVPFVVMTYFGVLGFGFDPNACVNIRVV